MSSLELTIKAAYPRARASLVRFCGDFDDAEDALQEAVARAMTHWKVNGIPEHPVAWLARTGRNYRIDAARRVDVAARHAGEVSRLRENAGAPTQDDILSVTLDDDLLRLIFVCCHPVLTLDGQVALTLRAVASLTCAEIARAFLVSPGTMEKRLTRAKARIRDDRIPYDVPSEKDLPERLGAVLAVIYLIFNEGYKATHGPELMRPELCNEAIRLARILARAFRQEPEVSGLLALMLLQHSRAAARTADDGAIVPLDKQDRNRWNQALIVEGESLLQKTLRRKQAGTYQIQAAIAALHSQAPSVDETDWAQIAVLYAHLERYHESPVITLNRAVAVARADGAGAGMTLLQTIEDMPEMRGYVHFHTVRASLLLESGRPSEARAAFERALAVTQNARELTFIEAKIKNLQ